MELSELFKKFSIETIEDKTNIAKEKLEDLKNRDWKKFKRAQALGFLNILEREFSVDLEEVKNECRNFFNKQEPQHTSASIDFVESQVANSSNGGVVSKVIAFITVAALAYAGWYYYNKQSTPVTTDSLELNSTTQESQENSQVESSENSNNSENKEQTEAQKQEQKEPAKEAQSKPEEKKDEQSGQKFNLTNTNTTNDSTTANASTTDTNSANSSTATNSAVANNKSVKAEVDSLLDEANKSNKEANTTTATTDNNTSVATAEQNGTKFSLDDTNASNKESNDSAYSLNLDDNNASATEAKLPDTIQLRVNSKKLWIGIYNLKTGKKVNKIIRRMSTLDLTNGKLAIITGHSRFSLVTDNETKKFKKNGKMYLLISKEDGIKELTRQEYKKLTKRKAY